MRTDAKWRDQIERIIRAYDAVIYVISPAAVSLTPHLVTPNLSPLIYWRALFHAPIGAATASRFPCSAILFSVSTSLCVSSKITSSTIFPHRSRTNCIA